MEKNGRFFFILWEEYLSDENQLFHHLRERESAIKGSDEKMSVAERKSIDNIIMQGLIANNKKTNELHLYLISVIKLNFILIS